jgi:hypothetical protein
MFHPGNKIISAAGLILLLSFIAAATECKAALSVTADASTVNFGAVTKSDLDNGFKELTSSDITYALRLTVIDDSSVRWTLNTKAETEYFSSFSGNKPCGDIRWRQNGAGIYNAYSTSDATVVAGSSDAIIDMDFKMLTGWNDKPGAYSINVIFTIFEN